MLFAGQCFCLAMQNYVRKGREKGRNKAKKEEIRQFYSNDENRTLLKEDR